MAFMISKETENVQSSEEIENAYMALMISKETENVQSSEEIENAFRAITSQERDYVTQDELHSNLSKEMADYCIERMKPYVDPRTGQGITGALDYMEFTTRLFS